MSPNLSVLRPAPSRSGWRVRFDANAGLPPSLAVLDAALEAARAGGNPSSVHAEGRAARARVGRACEAVAALAGVPPANLVFTGSATEAANWALTPFYRDGPATRRLSRVLIGATEHPAVSAGGVFGPEEQAALAVDRDGRIDLDGLADALRTGDSRATLVAIQAVNGETGVIQPVAAIGDLCRAAGALFLCDAAQAAGRVPLAAISASADLVILSAHKIGGLPGAGALALRDPDLCPVPLLRGGGQERGRRAGTENAPALAAFGVAAAEAAGRVADQATTATLRDRLADGLRVVAPTAIVAGAGAPRVANTAMLIVPGFSAETAVMAFDLEGVAISAGSACSSGKVGPSSVLAAMGFGDDARSGLRFSLPPDAVDADVLRAIDVWKIVHARLMSRVAA